MKIKWISGIALALIMSSSTINASTLTSNNPIAAEPTSRSNSRITLMESIIIIVSDVLGVEEEKIAPESEFYHDLGADSFDLVTIISKCESLYRITITDEDRLNIITVQDLYDVVWYKIQHSI